MLTLPFPFIKNIYMYYPYSTFHYVLCLTQFYKRIGMASRIKMEIPIMTSESTEKEGHLTLFPVNIITGKCRCVCAYHPIRKGIDSSLYIGKFLCNKFCMSIYSMSVYIRHLSHVRLLCLTLILFYFLTLILKLI